LIYLDFLRCQKFIASRFCIPIMSA
jgi:hypothetical protein